jgi:alpha-ketoglutarate-dependent taurine dioxygenase
MTAAHMWVSRLRLDAARGGRENRTMVAVSSVEHAQGTHIVEGRREPLSSLPREVKVGLVREHGAVLFRGFTGDSPEFRRLADELGHRFLNMAVDPRIREIISADGVVASALKGTSALPLHMERAYSPIKPELVMMHMIQPSPTGGESLQCNGANVLAHMSPALVKRFKTKRLKYQHAWEPQAWQGRYGATPEDVARNFATRPDVVSHSFEGDVLHYTYVCSAIQQSRFGGGDGFMNALESAWDVQHSPVETRRAVYHHEVRWEDDEPVTQELIDEVHEAVVRATEVHTLQPGDMIVLDNYRVMHGRRTFQGPRVMHTIMADAAF